MRYPRFTFVACFALFALRVAAQSPNANINGLVLDPSNQLIVGAEVIAVNDVTAVQYTTKTNNEGVYVLPNLPPGPYRVQVSKVGFKTIIRPDIVLNVQDALSINFTLPIGALLETVTVAGGSPLVNTESAAVSTVVDRQFAENLPMNGRSFQTLIELTPGVVVTPSSSVEAGQFSVNGQRTASNYWMVDGVGANIGTGANGISGNGLGGALGSFSVLGGTNSLVSVDALQEFRIQTSSYAPEFGRTPGAQISIVTRSGTNQFHGTAFDYLRNDVLDANDWFNTYVTPALPKAKERQNDFGGTFGGPIIKSRTFFFFSYEGLRLRLPQTLETTVPDGEARRNAIPAMQPFLNAFPMPNGPDVGSGMAAFNASFSNSSTLDAYSLRLDHRINSALNVFGRYDYSPSELLSRGNGAALSLVSPSRITTQTATIGVSLNGGAMIVDDLRFNYSRTNASIYYYQDDFGGAVPLQSLPLPAPFNSENAEFGFDFLTGANSQLTIGSLGRNIQRQINLVDNLSVQKGLHGLKFGVDYRRLSPSNNPALNAASGSLWYHQFPVFLDVPSAEEGTPLLGVVGVARNSTFLLRNLGVFAQDTWRILPRLTLTYGLRWDVDFAPVCQNGLNIPRVTNFNNLASLALAPSNEPPFDTAYGNIAPRIGVAYQVSTSSDWSLLVRGGVGVFYDLATSEAGNAIGFTYPFGATSLISAVTFPFDPQAAAPPPITPEQLSSPFASLSVFNPHLQLPYSLQWNAAIEEGLGNQQTLTARYIGSIGRRLLQTSTVLSPNQSFSQVNLIGNTALSDYNALQIQFQRRLAHGLQALASYTWSHSIDTGSAGAFGSGADALVPSLGQNANRGPSDFDLRNTLSIGTTYDVPTPELKHFTAAILGGWSLQNVIQVRSASPVNVYDGNFVQLANFSTQIRPDVVPGVPEYLSGAQIPGGKAFNPAAFVPPPTNSDGVPLRQGDLGRNALRGFGATQWDFAVHRTFPVRGSLMLQFRSEIFNVLNHPNFGPPIANIGNATQFGQSTQMLGQSLGGNNLGGGGLSPLYQFGGPRSIQFALKLMF